LIEELTLDLKPGESRVIPVSTNLMLAPMSSATLRLEAGGQKVDALTLSSRPQSAQLTLDDGPATRPSSDAASVTAPR
jgi:hypothetical protein